MSWFRVDDKYHSHRKVVGLPMAARGAWVTMGTWCSDHATDGEIPIEMAKSLGVSRSQIDRLCDRDWIEIDGKTIRLLGFLDYNPSRAQKAQEREITAKRVAAYRAKKGARNGVTDPITDHAYAPPGPARPDPSSTVVDEARACAPNGGDDGTSAGDPDRPKPCPLNLDEAAIVAGLVRSQRVTELHAVAAVRDAVGYFTAGGGMARREPVRRWAPVVAENARRRLRDRHVPPPDDDPQQSTSRPVTPEVAAALALLDDPSWGAR